MRLAVALLFAASALPADERWIEYRSGPFEVLTNAGERAGRETLARLEQFRHALGQVAGKTDPQATWPVRAVAFKSAPQQQAYLSAVPLGLARDAFTGSIISGPALPRPFMRALALLLLQSGSGRPTLDIEEGLADLFSTLAIDGAHLTLGQPPPAAERSQRWAKAHMLAVTGDYYGKLRVLARNLERGVEEEPAYRNAFGKTRPDIDKEAEAYLAAGNFGTVPLSGKPINPERDFAPKPVDVARQQATLADLLLADPARTADARQAYLALRNEALAEAHEGLGLLTLREGRQEEAREEFAAAVQAKTQSVRALFEYARLQSDAAKAQAALEQAVQRNPRWAAPHLELARRASDSRKKLGHLKSAALLEPRNPEIWIAVAEAALAAEDLTESARAWAGAERAAANPDDRERIRKLSADAQRKLEEQKIAAQRREEDEKRRELEKLKGEALARIRLAEAKANVGAPPPDPSRKVEAWWDDPRPRAKLRGTLRQIDCLGKRYRLLIEGEDRKLMRLLVPDPSRIVIPGGRQAFACGPQKPPRKIAVEYYAAPDAKLGTAGAVALLEFP